MYKLSCKECSLLSIKQTYDSDGIKELDSINELGKEIDIIFVFVGSDELHNKGRR